MMREMKSFGCRTSSSTL